MASALGAEIILVQIQVPRLPLCAGADNPECRWHKPHTALSVWSRRLSCRGSGRQSPSRWPTGFSEGKRGYLRMALLVYIVLGGKNPNQHTTALHGPETSSRRIGLSPASAGRGGWPPPSREGTWFCGRDGVRRQRRFDSVLRQWWFDSTSSPSISDGNATERD